MDRDRLVVLLYNAYESFSSIEALFRYTLNSDLMGLAWERSGGAFHRRQTDPKVNKVKHYEWHVWHRKPNCWRFENKEQNKPLRINVINGEAWWLSTPNGELWTNVPPNKGRYSIEKNALPSPHYTQVEYAIQEMPFLYPSFLLAMNLIIPMNSTNHAGREAIRIRAIPRKNRGTALDDFWSIADEYDLLVDKEKGILLRYSAKLDGQEFAIASADFVLFDQQIPDSVFCLFPEPKMKIKVFKG